MLSPRLSLIAATLMLLILAGLARGQDNPISNGGFEQVGADGWALNWYRMGHDVSLTTDSHSGAHAVLMRRNQADIDQKIETGLNLMWVPGSGQAGSLLTQLKGAVRFWYKVKLPAGVSGTDIHPRLYMIPMGAGGIENTGGQRQTYEVPADQFGDGKWHQGIIAYNFTDNANCKWAMVAPRVEGSTPANWTLDDLEWIATAGPVLTFAKVALKEVAGQEGSLGDASALIKNIGDQDCTGNVRIDPPAYLQCQGSGATLNLGSLAAGAAVKLTWRLAGLRDRPDFITFTATGGSVPATTRLPLGPKINGIWLETERFVLWPGKTAKVSVVADNGGTAASTGMHLKLNLPVETEAVGTTETTLGPVLPGTLTRYDFTIRAKTQTPYTQLACAWSLPDNTSGTAKSELVIGAEPPTPASVPASAARLACATFEILFPQNAFGYGPGWIYAKPNHELVGVIPWLGRAETQIAPGKPLILSAPSFDATATVRPLGSSPDITAHGLTFHLNVTELQKTGYAGPVDVSFVAADTTDTQAASGQTITHQLTAPAPASPLALTLQGPLFYAGEGSFGASKDEALYPGVEWLEKGEYSSNDLDISRDHFDYLRYVTQPNYVTVPLMAVRQGALLAGLFWHPASRWSDGKNRANLTPERSDVDRPAAIFATPDRFNGHAAQAMGLFVPTVPEYVNVNQTAPVKAWPAAGVEAHQVRLVSAIFVKPDATSSLDAVRAWYDLFGGVQPQPLPHVKIADNATSLPPTPFFRGYSLPAWAQSATRDGAWVEPTREQWIGELDWSTQAYRQSLWDPKTNSWFPSLGGPSLVSDPSPNPNYIYDCVIAARLTSDSAVRQGLGQSIATVRQNYPAAQASGDDLGFIFARPVDQLAGQVIQIGQLIKSQDPDGGWRFHPWLETGGIFKGYDYAELGYEGQEGNGLVAHNAWSLLRFARLTGDAPSRAAGLKALEYMLKFIVPRAAQVWEVPVHTPDILAGSDACEAYLEGYQLTGDARWLKQAVYWEQSGLLFVYQWNAAPYPWMRHGSIPVFGASQRLWSWIGRPVQWNGLRWAYAALKLAELDHSYPWRQLAAGVTISAMYQQGMTAGHDLALWPDSEYTINNERSGWLFAPYQINKNVYKLLGYEPEPVVRRVTAGAGEIAISACGKIEPAGMGGVNGDRLRFTVTAPAPLPSRVVVSAMDQPTTVTVNGVALARAQALPIGDPTQAVVGQPGWVWYASYNMLEISLGQPGRFDIEVLPAHYTPSTLVAKEATTIDFNFDLDNEGWRLDHDLVSLGIGDGFWHLTATNNDPYLVRENCRIDAASIKRVIVRMSVNAGNAAQFFFTTADSPNWAEDKDISVPVTADGQLREVIFDVQKHPLWRGTVTAIRLDPAVAPSDIRIDYIHAERENSVKAFKEYALAKK